MSAHHSRAFGNDSDSDSDHGSSRSGKGKGRAADEALVGFSARGAEKARRSPPRAKAKVIPLRGDSDWVAERKRRLDLGRHAAELGSLTSMRAPGVLGAAPPPNGAAAVTAPTRIGAEPAQVGLVIRRRERAQAEQGEDSAMADAGAGADRTPPASQTSGTPPPLDLEAEARAALLSGSTSSAAPTGPQRIIRIDEEALIKADAASRPDVPTLDDYAATPVSEFGAALLRGMGWKEGQGAGRKRDGPTSAPLIKKRAALLGLGAKERKVEPEAGGSRKGAKPQFVKRPDSRYVPLIKRAPAGDEGSSAAPSPAESRLASRAASPDRDAYRRRDERDRDRDRPRERERDRDYERGEHRRDREREYDSRDRERRHYDERDRERSSRHREDDRERDRSGRSYRDGERSERRDGDRNGSYRERDRERGSSSRRDDR